MAVPQLTPLPDPPSSEMTEAVFNEHADASLVGQKTMVIEYNVTVLPWVAQQLADTQSARDAGVAARNAAQAAQLAAEQAAEDAIENGAAQVLLAKNQADLAKGSADAAKLSETEAGVYASLAQTGAALPVTAGKAGYSLVVNPAADGYQLSLLSQAIGDVVITAAIPDATFVRMDRTYLRSAYPELFALLGTLSDEPATVAIANSATSPGGAVLYGNGRFMLPILAAPKFLSSPYNAWVNGAVPPTASAGYISAGDYFFSTVASSSSYYTSVDGVAWQARTALSGGVMQDIAYGNGTYAARLNSGTSYFTSPTGIGSWTQRTAPHMGTVPRYFGFAFGLFIYITTTQILTSPDAITWTDRTPAGFSGANSNAAAGITSLLISSNVADQSWKTQDGLTWEKIQVPYVGSGPVAPVFNSFQFEVYSSTEQTLYYSSDLVRWGSMALPAADTPRAAGSGIAISTSGATKRAAASYDIATQFYIPKFKPVLPVTTAGYMKAKLS